MVWNEELKREIPKGWEVKNAYEIADIKTGKEDANHATKNGNTLSLLAPMMFCDDDYKFDGNVILIAGNGDFNVKHYNGNLMLIKELMLLHRIMISTLSISFKL